MMANMFCKSILYKRLFLIFAVFHTLILKLEDKKDLKPF